jgi:SAM-dependent methyltransferase
MKPPLPNPLAWPGRFAAHGRLVLPAIRRLGLAMTVRIAVHELLFDWRYGTETRDYVEAEDIQTASRNKGEGNKYGPLPIPFFRNVFGPAGPVADRGCLVDFGCGKGRAMILAALGGFREVIGVEYSEALCGACRRNLAAFTARLRGEPPAFAVIHADAADYAVPDRATTLLFYNPFSPAVFASVLRNLRASLRRAPRAVRIVVFNCPESYKGELAGFACVAEIRADKTVIYGSTG